jgi:mannose-6-phosphate isomerase-like protein (cupin superfamily)
MPVVTPSQAPTFDAAGATVTGLASPSRGSIDTAAWRIRLPAEKPSPSHSVSREEIFVVVDGALTAQFHDRDETAEAGGALIVPAGEQFTLVARGGPAEAVCIMAVGGQATADGATFTPPWAQ